MRHIFAIGGGSIVTPKRKPETYALDAEIVKASGKKHPHVVFIPTASGDSTKYAEAITQYYTKHFSCRVTTLWLLTQDYSKEALAAIIETADIVYVGGGNTLRMMKRWRALGVDQLLQHAAKRGIVMCGLSAGAICWFREGHSDSLKYSNPKNPYIRVKGLDLIDVLVCPHYNSEAKRRADLHRKMKGSNTVAVGLENCSAIEVLDDSFRILVSNKTARAWRMQWHKKKLVEQVLPANTWIDLEVLF